MVLGIVREIVLRQETKVGANRVVANSVSGSGYSCQREASGNNSLLHGLLHGQGISPRACPTPEGIEI